MRSVKKLKSRDCLYSPKEIYNARRILIPSRLSDNPVTSGQLMRHCLCLQVSVEMPCLGLIWNHWNPSSIFRMWTVGFCLVKCPILDYQCAVLVCTGSATTKAPLQCKTTPQSKSWGGYNSAGPALLPKCARFWHSSQQSISQRGHLLLWPCPIGWGWSGVLDAPLEAQGELKAPLLFLRRNTEYLDSYFPLFWAAGSLCSDNLWQWADSINNILKATNIFPDTEGHLYTPGKNTDFPLKRSQECLFCNKTVEKQSV